MARTSRSQTKSEPSRARRIALRILKWGSALALLVAVGIAIAVGVAASNLPSFDELKRSPNGQTIRVRDANGAIIVSIGSRILGRG